MARFAALPACRQTGQALEVPKYVCVPSALHLPETGQAPSRVETGQARQLGNCIIWVKKITMQLKAVFAREDGHIGLALGFVIDWFAHLSK